MSYTMYYQGADVRIFPIVDNWVATMIANEIMYTSTPHESLMGIQASVVAGELEWDVSLTTSVDKEHSASCKVQAADRFAFAAATVLEGMFASKAIYNKDDVVALLTTAHLELVQAAA